jgi:hypothetical protein
MRKLVHYAFDLIRVILYCFWHYLLPEPHSLYSHGFWTWCENEHVSLDYHIAYSKGIDASRMSIVCTSIITDTTNVFVPLTILATYTEQYEHTKLHLRTIITTWPLTYDVMMWSGREIFDVCVVIQHLVHVQQCAPRIKTYHIVSLLYFDMCTN